MNHRTQNHHSRSLKASQNHLSYNLRADNTVVQMPAGIGYNNVMDANLADTTTRVELIQMADTAVMQKIMGPAAQIAININSNTDADLADRRVEIQRDDRLRLTWHEWENSLKKALLAVEFRTTRCLNVKNELYQLIGFYTVFQGVVLTAVVQGSLLKCRTSWGPASLSLLASIATIPAVHDRLKDYNNHKNSLFWQIEESHVINEKVEMLRQKGADFDFAENEGVKEKIHGDVKKQQFRAKFRRNYIVKVVDDAIPHRLLFHDLELLLRYTMLVNSLAKCRLHRLLFAPVASFFPITLSSYKGSRNLLKAG